MNLSEINWDINASGTWPLPVKAIMIALVCAIVAGAGIYLDTLKQLEELDVKKKKEPELKSIFEIKQQKAVNLQDYKNQLNLIEASLEEMIRQMPTEEEVASLLVDISQTGLSSGLEFKLFKPAAPIAKDFYSELPINIMVKGKYEELGLFVSGLASLPRIVTVHDVSIVPQDTTGKDKSGTMLMSATVKTYNERNGGARATSDKKKRSRK